jgi:hypothetical protein
MEKYPDLIVKKGVGTFSSGDTKFEGPFEITNYPEKTIIEVDVKNGVEFISTFISAANWTLNGLIDQGIPVTANDLQMTSINDKLTFELLTEIKFGDAVVDIFSHAEFPLIGYYNGKIDLDLNQWHINIEELENNDSIKSIIGKRWNLQIEGLTLKLEKSGSTIENFLTKANNITLLLSLAVGNSVIFNRQLYYNNNNLVLEIWRRKAGYHFGVEPCIPNYQINNFLKNSLGSFEKWGKKKKDLFYSTVNYINSANQGFLEDRLFRLCIAWESLSTKLVKGNLPTKIELELLKEFLRTSIDNFDLPDNYDKNFIKDRIVKSLDWEKLYISLITLVDHYELDYDKLHLDFKLLIKIRNDIAHFGQFRREYPKIELADLVFYNKSGLQVILLLETGYNDLIEFQNEKWVTRTKIIDLKKTST